MRAEIPGGDRTVVQRSAHTLKGSANLFFAKRVHDAALKLESRLAKRAGGIESDFQRLELEVEALHVIRNFLEVTAED